MKEKRISRRMYCFFLHFKMDDHLPLFKKTKKKTNFSATECVYGQDKKRTLTALVAIRYFGLKTYYKLCKSFSGNI